MINQYIDTMVGLSLFFVAALCVAKTIRPLIAYFRDPTMDPSAVPHHGLWTNLFQIWFVMLVPLNVGVLELLTARYDLAARYYVGPFWTLLALGGVAFLLYFFARLWHELEHEQGVRAEGE